MLLSDLGLRRGRRFGKQGEQFVKLTELLFPLQQPGHSSSTSEPLYGVRPPLTATMPRYTQTPPLISNNPNEASPQTDKMYFRHV
jgi:hypothetical protein